MNGYLIAGCVLTLAGALLLAVEIALADPAAGESPARPDEVDPRVGAAILIGAIAAGALAGYLWPAAIGEWYRRLGLPMP